MSAPTSAASARARVTQPPPLLAAPRLTSPAPAPLPSPRQSGHGWCDENDACICFRAPGTANQHTSYIGADCSQRVCPYGLTHDYITDAQQELQSIWSTANSDSAAPVPYIGFIPNPETSVGVPKLNAFLNGGFLLQRDYGVDVNVVSVPQGTNTIKFQWKLSTEKTFRSEITASQPTGLYTTRAFAYHIMPDSSTDSGLYIYFDTPTTADVDMVQAQDRYFLNVTFNDGVTFSPSDPNTAHQIVECSARGTCNRAAGTCSCSVGFTGDACERSVCPNDCSGNGVCQSEMYFVQDAVANTPISGVSYIAAFDANISYGCACDRGFRGPDCSQRECPSGPDVLDGDGGAQGMDCSGRGMCNYAAGMCTCYKGFFGERCEEQTTLI